MKVQANAMTSIVLWHSCLEHPSNHILLMFSKHLRVRSCFEHNKVDVYEVCIRAKQTRNSFPISESNSNGLFEITHRDI